MMSFRALIFCCRNGIMADSSFFTVTGAVMLYWKRSAISVAELEETTDPTELDWPCWPCIPAEAWTCKESERYPPATPPPPPMPPIRRGAAAGGGGGALAACAPVYTVGATGLSSARSAPRRVMNLGAYNWLMNEIGLPDTSDNFKLVQSSPVVLSTIAQPSRVGSPFAPSNDNRLLDFHAGKGVM